MKHLRLFENYKSDEEIHKICEIFNIKSYTINKDGSVDVDGNVLIPKIGGITELPLVFNRVSSIFKSESDKLTSLKGSPRIVGDSFIMYFNNIPNLIGGPEEVSNNYMCFNNKKLTSLEGIAKIIGGNLDISNCNLSDFRGLPEDFYVGGIILFTNNPVYNNLKEFLMKYDIDIDDIRNKYLNLFLEINELDAIQNGKIIDIRMDEVLYNIGLI